MKKDYYETGVTAHFSTMSHLFEGLSKLSSRSHTKLLCDVSRDFEQENLHQARHQPVLTITEERNRYDFSDPSISVNILIESSLNV